jgi:branched-chain amino acid transport system permease protein
MNFDKVKNSNSNNIFTKYQHMFLLSLLILLIIFPQLTNNQYYIYIAAKVLLYMILASSLNIIAGYTYQYLIGFVAFFAIGSYSAAIISKAYNINFILVFLLSGLICSIFGVLLGIPASRLGGIFFAFATLGFSEIVRLIIINWDSLTRGTFGIPGIPSPELFNLKLITNSHFYYMGLLLLAVMLFISNRIIKSRIGRAWLALKENQEAARAMGVDVVKYKIMNLAYGSFWAGIGGAFYAYFTRYVSPDTFVLDESFRIFAMVLVGGMGTLAGPIVGSGVLVLLPEIFREFARYQLVIYGIAILLVIHYRPQGLLGARELAKVKVEPEEVKQQQEED